MTSTRLPTAQRQQQLADAALSILCREGARAVTVAAIARRVGISNGAVFRHFENTQALFEAAAGRFEDHMTPLPTTGDPLERLGVFFVERVGSVQRNPDILGLTMADRLQELAGGQALVRIQKHMQASSAFVREALSDAQGDGDVEGTLDPQVLTWMVTGAMRGAVRSGADAEQAWTQVRATLCGTPAPKRRRRRAAAKGKKEKT